VFDFSDDRATFRLRRKRFGPSVISQSVDVKNRFVWLLVRWPAISVVCE